MDTDSLKEAYRRIIDAISRGDADALDELVTPDIVDHNPVPDQAPGVEGFKQWMAYARSSFPDFAGTVEDVIAEGDRVAGLPQAFPELTAREREILDHIAQGLNNEAIARKLFLSPKTVRNHVSNIFAKLQVADRAQAIVRARDAGLGRAPGGSGG